MSTLYKTLKNRVERALRSKKRQQQLKDPATNWFQSIVGRRILHRYIQKNPEFRKDVQTLRLPESSKTAMLKHIQMLADNSPEGMVTIEGDLDRLDPAQWLDVEHALVQAMLNRPNKKQVAYSELSREMDLSGITMDMPKFLYGFCNVKYGVSLSCVLMFLSSAATLFSSHTIDSHLWTAVLVMLSGITTTFGAMLLVASEPHGISEEDLDAMTQGLSGTWDEVFAMTTMEDAILMGMASGIIARGLGSDTHRTALDVTGMSPASALRLMTLAVDGRGGFNTKRAEWLISAVENCPDAPNENAIHGVDLSRLRKKEIEEVKEVVPAQIH